ncbi:LysM peptidoglycan-binding domain-containing protein [Brevundimonas faecalis]|uniref:LysM peptidoglycan-binding domain-containing protein n=1 Tax=Brevundimonas faecalis TaxID=947378 RepID=UPI00361BC8EE
MAAVVIGSRLGLEQSSAWLLGSRGQLGQAATGRAGENLYVNAATGNLVLSQQDEFLIGLGPDAAVSRVYNSQGALNDEWRAGALRRVHGLSGSLNAVGSTIRRTDWDGSEAIYAWEAGRSAYVSTDGSGVYDSLRLEGTTWIWTDGDTRVVERYDQTNDGRLVSSTDIDGNVLTYTYNAQGAISRVTTADGGYTEFVYAGGNLARLVTTYRDTDNQLRTLTRVRYAYDAQNRLSSVTVDLTPGDNAIADGAVYVTTYQYDGSSRRVASVSQTDGSRVDIAYVQSGGVYRVAALTEAVAGGVSRTTSFSYDSASQTTITDPAGRQTVLTHANGRLDRVTAPSAYAGAPAQVTEYVYNAWGDLLRVQTAPGVWTDYEYAPGTNGVWTTRRDSQGLTTTRTLNAAGQVLTETQYTVADPDGAGSGQPSGALTTRYVYDARGRMTHAISAEGRVTRFGYDAQGRQTSIVVFTADRMDLSSYAATAAPNEAAMATVIAGFDQSRSQRTDIAYDFRGAVATVSQYGTVEASGAGSTTNALTRTHYVYDQTGALLMRRVEGLTGAEVFVYDGMGRVVRSIDFNSQTTRTAYHDAAGMTVVATAGGLNKISSYNLTGELISYTESERGPDLVDARGWPQNLGALPSGPVSVGGWENPWYKSETRWQTVIGPDGRPTAVIEAGQFDTNNQGGGSATNDVQIDASKAYEFVFYFKKSDLSRHGIYLGLNDNWDTMEPYVEYASGSGPEVNPYFFQGKAADLQAVLDNDRWYKVVGYVLPQNSGNIPSGSLGGVFDMTTGEKVHNAVTFRWSADRPNNAVHARFFTAYDPLNQGYSTYFGRPEIREFDLASSNLINNSDWPTGIGGVPTGPANPSSWSNPPGSTDEYGGYHAVETQWRIVDGPDGRQIVAIESGQTDPDAAGGGNITNLVTIDGNSAYQFVYYFQKHDLTKHSLYLGLSRNLATPYVESAVTGAAEGNPYFLHADLADQTVLSEDRWYKVVGYVLPQGSTLQSAGQWGGVFDAETGEKVADTETYRWSAGRPNDKVYSRFFNFYNQDQLGYSTYFGQPEIHKIDVSRLAGQAGQISQGPTTRYRYDALGRLRQVADPTGGVSHLLYDGRGRKTAEIDADGSVVEYRYDDADRLIATIQWAQKPSAAQLASLTDAAGAPAAVDIAAIRPAAHADDVWNWSIYDASGRLVQTIDGEGGSVRYTWDGASRLTSTTHRLVAFTPAELAAFRAAPPLGPVGALAPHPQDRTTRHFYDADGLKIGVLDGEGYLSRIVYDNAGRVIQTTAYAVAAPEALRAAGSFASLLVGVGSSASDINTWSVHDGRGFLKATVNGEGDVETFDHDAMGGVIVHKRGMRLAGGPPSVAPTLAQLVAAPAAPTIETTTYVRNHFGQVLSETRQLATGVERVVNHYDAERRLVRQSITRANGHARSIQLRYDRFGRLTGQLEGEGALALDWLTTKGDAPPQSRIDEVYVTRGVTFAYDDAGRMIRRTDPDGVWGSGRKTTYFYDDDGNLRFEVNASGEVLERRYDNLGRLSETVAYANRISISGLQGGLLSQHSALPVVAHADDRRTVTRYTAVGAVRETTDAVGVSTQFAYNAFGELTQKTESTGTTAQPTTTATTYAYDRRGLLTSTTLDSGGPNLTTQVVYDAFGRTVELKDPRQVQAGLPGVRTAYDRAGRVIRTTDPSGDQIAFTWDARGHKLTQTDALGRTTHWTVSAFGRQVAVTTPEGLTSTTVYLDNGLVQTFTDGAGRTVSYAYDRNGDVLSVTDGAGVETYDYDNIGRLVEKIDASGRVVEYTYDAADRLLTETIDPNGLALQTRYVYDAFGGRIQVTDGSGRVTAYEFDRNGRQVAMVVDPSTHALRTTWAYDRSGEVVALTEAAGTAAQRETRHVYDKAGRLIRQETGPAALNIRTSFAYDANGNVIERRDAVDANPANDVVTQYVYDAENQLVATIDGVGAVSRRGYDAKGRLILLIEHAERLSPAQRQALGAQPSDAQVIAAVLNSPSDRTTGYVYDNDDRLVFTVDAAGRATEHVYDGSGAVVRTVQYAGVVTGQPGVAPPYGRDALAAVLHGAAFANAADNRTTVSAYDAVGRRRYAVDAMGYVTAFVYDPSGRVVKSVQYATASTGQASLAQLDAWTAANGSAQDRTTRVVYDGAGRATYTVDAEGYVTRTSYSGDLVQSVSRFSSAVAVADGATAATLAALVAAQEASAAKTVYGYDQARRVNEITDAMGVRTRLELDALGRTVREWTAFQTADQSAVSRIYDAAGRVTSETRGEGTAAASTSTFTYDGLGRQLTATNGRGFTTTRTWDAMGRLLTSATPLADGQAAVTTNAYDAFGNVVRVTDPRGSTGYFWYDKLDRLSLQTDPEGYVTINDYGMSGEIIGVKRFAQKVADPASPLPLPDSPADAYTRFTRDKLDRVVAVTDALNATETYTLDAFGNRIRVTDRLGAQTTFTYDRRGLKTSETLPVQSVRSDGSVQATAVVNQFAYDARGNLVRSVEAAGLSEQRVTAYAYDALDRLVSKTGDALFIVIPTGTPTVVPVERILYDARGNVVETIDAAGARTLFYYDSLNRKVAEIDAVGTFRAWTYDAADNAISQRVYDTPVAQPGVAGGTATAPSGYYRETLFSYDRNNRLIATVKANQAVGEHNGAVYWVDMVSIVDSQSYDAAGNVVRRTDGRGVSTWLFYDKLGRKVAEVDPDNFLTTFEYDAEGNVLREVRYAQPVQGGFDEHRPAGSLPPRAPSAAAGDRITEFTYDKAGRRLTEKRLGVQAYSVDPVTGALNTASGDALISYAWDALGNVTRRTEANGDFVDYGYDALGRQTSALKSATVDFAGNGGRLHAQTFYDGLGSIVRTHENSFGSGDLNARITQFTYGAGGRLASMTDAAGFTRSYYYDAAGRMTRDGYVSRIRSDGSAANETQIYYYDAVGRLIHQSTAFLTANGWAEGDVERRQYNAHGEMTAKGVNGLWQETWSYDAGGRVTRTTANDGVVRFYIYDRAGNVSLEAASSGADLSGRDIWSMHSLLSGNGAHSVGAVAVEGVTMTVQFHNARNQLIETRELFRQLSATNTGATITRSRAYNAFGEVVSETDPRGGVTDYSYNTMGRLIRREAPTVAYTSETGVVAQARPAEDYYFDISGRMVASRDANGNLTRRLLRAGTGHQQSEALTLAEFHADGGVLRSGYDIYGDLRTITNELGGVEQRDYDAMGRLTTVRHEARPANTPGNLSVADIQLIDYYAYDGLGQRIQHWNNQFGAAYKERTDYDHEGRVVLTVDFEGRATTTSYVWDANLTTTGLGHFGGWVKTVNTASSKTSVERIDLFGRTVGRTDLGGRTYAMSFDRGGRMTTQTSSAGQSLGFSWYNTGLLAQQSDMNAAVLGYSNARTQAIYEYDVAGNRVRERYVATQTIYFYNPGDQWNPYEQSYLPSEPIEFTKVRQDAFAVYDALNRLVEFRDITESASDPTLVTYAYDLNGNIRRMTSDYRQVDQTATVTTPINKWYAYDAMNRMTRIDAGHDGTKLINGTRIEYDAAGNRRRSIVDMPVQTTNIIDYYYVWDERLWEYIEYPVYEWVNGARVEEYDYTADGYLSRVGRSTAFWDGTNVAQTPVEWLSHDMRDAMGRLSLHQEFANGAASGATHSRNAYYDKTGLLLSEFQSTWTREGSGSGQPAYTTTTTTDYNYYEGSIWRGVVTQATTSGYATWGAQPKPSSTTYEYVWWDDARQARILYDSDTTANNTINTSTFAYDVNGWISYVNIQDGRPRNVTYITDANGQVLTRTEADNLSHADPMSRYYYFNGQRVGEVTNDLGLGNWSPYFTAMQIRNARPTSTLGIFKTGWTTPLHGADFDTAYEALTPNSVRGAGAAYTVRDGDTLRSIAASAWGDASLWYMIAEANGLTSASQLVAGQTLTIPAKVANVGNTSDTFRPYDPNKAIGDVNPTQPKPPANPAKNKGCGVVGQIIAVVIAVAVSVLTYGALSGVVGSIAAGAIGGAAGSIASQGFLIATGAQDGFDWKGVGLAAIGGAVGAGLKLSPLGGKGMVNAAARGVAGSVITQGVGVATGLQDRFSWTSVAVAGVSAAVADKVSGTFKFSSADPAKWNTSDHLKSGVAGLAGAVAGAGAQSLIEGSSFGDNLKSSLPSVIGNTLGAMVAGRLTAPPAETKDKGLWPGTMRIDPQTGQLVDDLNRYFVAPNEFVGGGQPAARRNNQNWVQRQLSKISNAFTSGLNHLFRGGRNTSNPSYVSTPSTGAPSDSNAYDLGFINVLGRQMDKIQNAYLLPWQIGMHLVTQRHQITLSPGENGRLNPLAGPLLMLGATPQPPQNGVFGPPSMQPKPGASFSYRPLDTVLAQAEAGPSVMRVGMQGRNGTPAPSLLDYVNTATVAISLAAPEALAFKGAAPVASRSAGAGVVSRSAQYVEPTAFKLASTAEQLSNWGTGPLRNSARPLLTNEGVLIDASHGLQSRTSGLFDSVTLGKHGNAETKYLYTIDDRGVNLALESTPFPTPRGNIVHTNISSKASIGGEAWFGPNNSVTINAGSGRFGDGAGVNQSQWNATVKLWESLGYKVNPIPFGNR